MFKGSKILIVSIIILLIFQPSIIFSDDLEIDNQAFNIKNKLGNNVTFNVSKEQSLIIGLNELEEIANDHPEADNITIHNIIEADNSDSEVKDPHFINPPPRNVVISRTHKNIDLNTTFITSVARGGKKSIKETFSRSSSITGGLMMEQLSIKAGASYSVDYERTFEGPPHNSSYNSTSFYIRWRGNKGSYTAEKFDPSYLPPGYSSIENYTASKYGWRKVSGKFTEVTRGIEYSVNERL